MLIGNSLTQRDIAELRGKPVDCLFPVILRLNEGVQRLRFESFTSSSGISDRVKASLSRHQEWLDALDGSSLSPEPGVSLWDKLATKAMASHGFAPLPDDVLDVVIRHSANPTDSAFEVSSSEVLRVGISKLTMQVVENQIFAICSRVPVNSSEDHHIPMLDFLCPCSESNQASILNMLRRIGEDSGAIVESGRSYHYYGFRLLAQRDWVKFMAKALMFAPFSDPRYIAHRLIDGQCRLRVYSRSRTMPRIGQVF